MPLSLEEILTGVIEFSGQSQPQITQFIANVDMMITLATDQTDTVLTVIRTRLANASALGDISNKTWPEIRQAIQMEIIRIIPKIITIRLVNSSTLARTA